MINHLNNQWSGSWTIGWISGGSISVGPLSIWAVPRSDFPHDCYQKIRYNCKVSLPWRGQLIHIVWERLISVLGVRLSSFKQTVRNKRAALEHLNGFYMWKQHASAHAGISGRCRKHKNTKPTSWWEKHQLFMDKRPKQRTEKHAFWKCSLLHVENTYHRIQLYNMQV